MRRWSRRGQAYVELLLAMPVAMLLFAVILGLGWAYWVQLNADLYAQELALRAGQAGAGPALQEAQRFLLAMGSAGRTVLREVGLRPFPFRRGLRSHGDFEGPRMLLFGGLRPPEIRMGTFQRLERFYGGPPDLFE